MATALALYRTRRRTLEELHVTTRYSVPTWCISGCRRLIDMIRLPLKQSWICPHCLKQYPIQYWKIRERRWKGDRAQIYHGMVYVPTYLSTEVRLRYGIDSAALPYAGVVPDYR